MTAPYHPYYPPQQPPPKRHSTIDAVATAIMCMLAFGAAGLSFFYSLFFAMVTDACSTSCNTAPLGWAYVVTWGGLGLATVITIAGLTTASRRGRIMWIWPTLALVLIIVATISGVLLADMVITHH
jgi:hypothetical protein